MGVNHFGHFLLTNLLLEDLKKGSGISRVVIVSSSFHDPNIWAKDGAEKINLLSNKHLNDPSMLMQNPSNLSSGRAEEGDAPPFNSYRAYRLSKLCNVMFGYELQRKLNAQGVGKRIIVNSLCPGFIPWSGLTRRTGWLGSIFLKFFLDGFRVLFNTGPTSSWEDGGITIFSVATGAHITEGGKHFVLPKGELKVVAKESSDESKDEKKAKKLWDISLKVCKM